YATPSGPGVIAVGDLNRDGYPDLVTSGNGSSLAVLLGNGDGTFQHYTAYTVPGQAFALAIGDINGDGAPDVIVASEVLAEVAVLLGNGDGTLRAYVASDCG